LRCKVRFSKEERENWLLSFLPKDIELRNGMAIPITDDLKEKFIQSIDYKQCPALYNKLVFYDGRILSPNVILQSELEDHSHLVDISYCDLSFTDGQVCELL